MNSDTTASCSLRLILRSHPRRACRPSTMFSATVRSGTMPSARRSSEEYAMRRCIAARGEDSFAGTPSISITPWSARSAPYSSRTSSVRPEPSSPAMPTTSPG